MSVNNTQNPECNNNPLEKAGAKWIWPLAHRGKNQYVEFRDSFAVSGSAKSATLYISVDTDYAVWINGKFVHCGQFHNFPQDKTYDTLDVSDFLNTGENCIAILGFHQGENSFQYLPGEPGLIFALYTTDVVCKSGTQTLFRKSRAYTNGAMDKITPQLGFNFKYNAAGEDNWREPGYATDGEWAAIAEEETKPAEYRSTRQRPISKLDILDRLQTSVVSQGSFKRLLSEEHTVAAQMQSDLLAYKHPTEVFGELLRTKFPSNDGATVSHTLGADADGVFLVLDLGREEAGVFEIDIDTPEATDIDIAWGEHLDDMRVRAMVGGRNFASKMTTKPGRQVFTHYFLRMAGRYLQLHIHNPAEGTKIYYAGLKPTDYPLENKGKFFSPDKLQEKIFDVARRTLHLCMHEHYEDCPWREQALYGMDSRNQALSGYYAFGEYDFPAASFKLLGDSLKEDGYQELCAPMTYSITIPSFSKAWIVETWEQYLYSGCMEAAEEAYPKVKKMMDIYIASMKNGVLPCPVGERYWQFYDWADGLSGVAPGTEGRTNVTEERYDSTLNGFFALALKAAVGLAEACGHKEDAAKYAGALEKLRANFHTKFWDDEGEAYLTSMGEGIIRHFAELPQALAILTELAPENVAIKLRARLASGDNGLVETTLSQSIYKFDCLLQQPEEYASWVFDKIARDWSHMLMNGATSFWETIKGGDDFGYAGSLCHGWSGTPVYFYMAYLLGIKPTSPGFATFSFNPVLNVVEDASGSVPTPHGPIEVDWTKTMDEVECDLKYPDTIKGEIIER